jgi:hypothetical protein
MTGRIVREALPEQPVVNLSRFNCYGVTPSVQTTERYLGTRQDFGASSERYD